MCKEVNLTIYIEEIEGLSITDLVNPKSKTHKAYALGVRHGIVQGYEKATEDMIKSLRSSNGTSGTNETSGSK